MSEWKTYKLGDLIEKITKGTTPSTLGGGFTESGINFIKSEAVSYEGRIDKSTFVFISEETNEKLKRSQLQEGDILFSMAGIFLGKNAIVTKDILPANTNQALAIIRIKDEITTPTFVHYYLRLPDVIKKINSISGQSAQPNINFEEIKSIEIKIPDEATQTQIAKILTSLDDKIELNLQMNQTLEAMAQAIFKEWFVDFKFPNFDGELIDGLPKGWRMGKLGEMVDVKGGTTPSTTKEEYWNGEFYWTTPKDLSNIQAPVLIDTERKITELGVKQISSGVMPKGTLLLSSRAPIGYIAISQVPISINQGYIAIQGKLVSNLFMLFWLKQNMEAVKSKANGSTFQEISKSNFREIESISPTPNILKLFDEIVTPIFEKIIVNVFNNQTLTANRDTLLPKLMSGKIEIKNQDEE